MGVGIEYREQAKPEGIAQAFLIADDFVGGEPVVLMLDDNIFSGGDDFPRAISSFESGATIFAYHVKDPAHYGVMQFNRDGKMLSLEEKPSQPKSSFAVPGVYI